MSLSLSFALAPVSPGAAHSRNSPAAFGGNAGKLDVLVAGSSWSPGWSVSDSRERRANPETEEDSRISLTLNPGYSLMPTTDIVVLL
jgi:hypothetical protein